MLFGGLQKNSFIDYPGKWSCVCFLSGCNFDCPYCHNPGLVRGGSSTQSGWDEQGFFRFLEERKGFLDGVVVSGVSPVLHANNCEAENKINRIDAKRVFGKYVIFMIALQNYRDGTSRQRAQGSN